jgi:hypothetical protein
VSTLHLTDPQANEFNARHCTAYQDIIRFAREKFLESQFGYLVRWKIKILFLGRDWPSIPKFFGKNTA